MKPRAKHEKCRGSVARDDFAWMRGANYIPTYAATDVQMWLCYDHDTIARELGFARNIGLNCVRVWLQSLVFHHQPERFLASFEDFLSTADALALKVIPILFDSCFGVAPSLESKHMWVANPGPDRMAEEFWPESDMYVRAVVSRYIGDSRVALWDVMNEPTATFLAETAEGRGQIDAFVSRYCTMTRELDPSHAVTVGVATADNGGVIALVDVLSCHSYAPGIEAFRKDLSLTRSQASAAGKPWIVSECGNPACGNSYEMVMSVLREFGVGYCLFDLVIGKHQFNRMQGLYYADGTVRRISEVEAVMNAPAPFLKEKPDSDGVPFSTDMSDRVAEYVAFAARNPVTNNTWRERSTLVYALIDRGDYGEKSEEIVKRLETAREAYRAGRRSEAFRIVAELLGEAAAVLSPRDAPPAS